MISAELSPAGEEWMPTMIDLHGYKLTFDEEFNNRSISQDGVSTKWSDIRSEWRIDAHSDIGFGRSSFMDASSGYDPFQVSNGALTITAVPDRTPFGHAGSWESGLIHTKGEFAQTYGYFEIRADFSDTIGAWDAFWMLPVQLANDRPGWQELDIVEHYGSNNEGTYSWVHTTDPSSNPSLDRHVYSGDPATTSGFHTYGILWDPQTIGFYVDGVLKGTKATPSDMHSPMYLLANLATEATADPSGPALSMKIDYIRAFSNDPNAPPKALDTISAPDGRDPGLYGATSGSQLTVPIPQVPTSPPIADDDGLPNAPGEDLAGPVTASPDDDNLTGTFGNDLISGGDGRDVIGGLAGDDMIYGNRDEDILYGNEGSDQIFGGQGGDLAYGGQGEDIIYGNLGDDTLYGNLGGDTLFGNEGDDTFQGGQGNDILFGGQGNDRVSGDLGDDTMTGGIGSDVFSFHPSQGDDIVTDFDFDKGDRLALHGQTYAAIEADGTTTLILSGGGTVVLIGVIAGGITSAYF